MKNNCFFILSEDIKEYQLQHFWSCIKSNTVFRSICNKVINIVSPGTWNNEEGPDFKNAVVEINGTKHFGDIEIHLSENGWINHGHNKDPRYSNVILHIVHEKTDSHTLQMPTIVIENGIIKEFNSALRNKFPKGYCSKFFKDIPDRKLNRIFISAGLERLKLKSREAADNVLRNGADKTIQTALFESLGYKKNKEQFKELYRRFSEYDLNTLTKSEVNSILWGESGLLPSRSLNNFEPEMQEFIKKTWKHWWKLRQKKHKAIKWNLCGVRPQNHPCKRIAALTVLLNRISLDDPFGCILNTFNSLKPNSSYREFEQFFLCSNSLWDKYSGFSTKPTSKSAVLGHSRSLDIIINIILPTIYGYGKINKNQKIVNKVINLFLKLPPAQDNIILKMSTQRWLIPGERSKKVISCTASQQGVIHLCKNYCEKLDMQCSKCIIPRTIPNL
ncbi:MAG: DUF2851 family protein [Victivallales bacterium]|nr:DUF2851 family protein [Victivallales bacterium]MCF7889421.1 DUF2851 family protein [Victivallales bacterium]